MIVSPNGTAIKPVKAPMKIKNGAKIKRGLSAVAGIMSSFIKSFNPSATGCNSPHLPACNPGPCPIGPVLSCMNEDTFISEYITPKPYTVIKPRRAAMGINMDKTRKIELPARFGKSWFKLSNIKSTVIYRFHLEQCQDYLKLLAHLTATNRQQSHPLPIKQ